jgi:hypothetical protein
LYTHLHEALLVAPSLAILASVHYSRSPYP